jgi:hypothetical protein
MSHADLAWLPPVVLAIAVVLGCSGPGTAREALRKGVRSFVGLTGGVLLVGLVIHLVARLLA